MKTNKLLELLAEALSKEANHRKAKLKSLNKLLAKLDKKEIKIGSRLEAADALGDAGEALHKRLSDKLKVLRAQYAKGVRLREELAGS